MKKKKSLILLALLLPLFLLACGKESGQSQKTITIGTTAISQDVLDKAIDVFNKSQNEYKAEKKVFDDAVGPNIGAEDGSLDATLHQHEPYLNNFNKEKNGHLKKIGPPIFAVQMGLYATDITDRKDVKDGMTVALSNDVSNGALALQLLEQEGLIKLDPSKSLPAVEDITENPHNLKFIEMERMQLANALTDADLALVMSDVMKEAGHDPAKALAYAQEPGIYLVVKEEAPWNDAFIKALTSQEVKDYINNETEQTKKALF